MSFDEIRLPLRVEYGAQGGAQFQTEVVVIDNGFERRNQKWSQAHRCYDARTGVTTGQDAAILLGFFQARAGKARGFRVQDWADYSSAADGKSAPLWEDQIIAHGDGVKTSFQLIKNYGDEIVVCERIIRKPVEASVVVGVDDTEYLTGWSVEITTGIISFAQAPAMGTVIKAGFLFDVPVRFDTDTLNVTTINQNIAKTEIPMIEVRV